MRKLWLWLRFVLAGFALLAGGCVALLGPWPVYDDSRYRESSYYPAALEAIDARARAAGISDTPGELTAGWAVAEMTPPVGAPLAGFSSRKNGKRSEGVLDPLHARALALGDGADTVVILVADALIIPPNIASAVRSRLLESRGLSPDDILFNATHTHCGPGGFSADWGSRITGGRHDPAIEAMLVDALASSAESALADMGPAELGSGGVDVPELIKNRARDDGAVDPELSFLSLLREDGRRCIVASYAAHPTVLGHRTLKFSRDYPGHFQDFVGQKTGATVIFLSGAVGSMGPDSPAAEERTERAAKMGAALGRRLLGATSNLEHHDEVDLASLGVAFGLPPLQLRPTSTRFRLSPWIARRIGAREEGWFHAVRLGDVLLVGLPFDFSGETSLEWKAWAAERGIDLWPLSFSGAYCGYLSPDRYYRDEPLDYEMGLMNWYGPNMEAYMTDLYRKAFAGLVPEAAAAPPLGAVQSAVPSSALRRSTPVT